MVDRQGKGRDCRDGAWVAIGDVHHWPRRSMQRLRADYWRMTASFVDTW